MLIPTPSRILVARDPVDFRKSIDGLAAVCEVHLQEQPLDGTLFVFRNRRKTAVKLLVWTHGGFVMLYKKLEQGRFAWPPMEADRVTISPAELAAIMEGLDLSTGRRLHRWNPRKSRAHADRTR